MKRAIAIILLFVMLTCSAALASEINGHETVDNLIALWQENGIYLNDLELLYSFSPVDDHDFYIFVYDGGRDFRIIYRLHSDKEVIFVEVPWDYRPKVDMYALTISYFMGISLLEAQQVYDSLVYNMINSLSEREYDNIHLVLFETGAPELMVTRTFAN
jgi:hypothetical protein